VGSAPLHKVRSVLVLIRRDEQRPCTYELRISRDATQIDHDTAR
jgi:hypothetical protein